MENTDTILRSGKIIEKNMTADDNMARPPFPCPSRSSVSTASKKTLLEARARREIAEVEHARLINEKLLIETRLAEQLALIESDDKSDRPRTDVEQWVDQTTKQDKSLLTTRTQEQPDNSIALLAHAITDALKKTTNDAPVGDKLIGRLSAKHLPIYSGDALDWLRFKNAFETTTAIGQYTDQENVTRLQKCLTGVAYEAVAARLITATSATDIMKTLEIRFGRPDLVMYKLIGDIKRLPKLTGARSDLLVLATKVSNCVAAIEATNSKDYLYSPELTAEVINKLTEPLIYRWLDYWSVRESYQPRLSALAGYLMHEAERVCKAGVVELPQKYTRYTPPSKQPVLAITEDKNIAVSAKAQNELTQMTCLYCDKADHLLDKCSNFLKLEVNKRWDFVCEKKLCFRCLSLKHHRERCRKKMACTTCRQGHHSLLHRDDWNKSDRKNQEPKPATSSETAANIWDKQSKKVFLKILPVVIEGTAGRVKTCALLDEGSTVTLIEQNVADIIGVEGPSTDLNLRGAMGDSLRAPSCNITLTIKTPEGDHRLERVRTVEKLTLPTQSLDYAELGKLPHLKDVPLQTFKGKPTLIIGQDHWHLIVSRELREGRKNEPVASLTLLGWVLHGFASNKIKNIFDHSCHVREDGEDDLHELVKSYFRFDSIGIKHEDGSRHSAEERRALNILDTKSKKVGDRWETGLLWRSDDIELPDNKRNAISRLTMIEQTMDDDPSFAADYTKQVVNLLEKEYAKEVTEPLVGRRVWFLPHFGVRNQNKPGKLRLVFDAKATTKGIALNTELLSGPDLLNSLVGILLRFRERAVAVTGDIREMFLQIKINEEDQKSQCFLWREMDRFRPPRIFKMTSMTFGATSSPCTATYILRCNADEFSQTHPRAVEAIKRRHYVDDYLDSVDTEEEMKRLITDVIMIHKARGFEIRGWASNKPRVLPQIPESTSVSLLHQTSSVERTLGLIWEPGRDLLCFDVTLKKVDEDVVQGLRRPTKREILRIIMSVFDPLGFLCPILIRGKILLQDIWRSGIRWDQQIGEKAASICFRWLRDIKDCRSLLIPRCYCFTSLDDLQLHVFVDASEQAYASVVYLRRDGQVNFVAAKSRVAPLKSSTIPRLELQAALMGTRLGVTVAKEQDVKINKRYFWTDSQTVWWWINNSPRQKIPFISTRLSEIDDLTRPEEWRWLPGPLNTADCATRADGTLESISSKWMRGPEFLYQTEENWPSAVPRVPNKEEPTEAAITATITQAESLMDYKRFSNWRRMQRCMGTVIVFTERCKKILSHLSPQHERRAAQLILRQVQSESFGEELQAIRKANPLSSSSRLRKLNPHLHEDVCCESTAELNME